MRDFFKKHIWIIVIMVLVLTFPAGLTNQAKLNMRTIVTGLAIDKADDGYAVTAQVVKTVSGTESSGIGAEIEFLDDKAPTISKALSNLLYKAGKFSAFSHTNFIILGKDVLEEDVKKCLDIFLRDKVIKNSALVMFTEKKASDEIKKTKNLELSVGLGLQKVYSFKQEESEGLMMTLLDFLVANNTYGKTALASVFVLEENNSSGGSSGGSGSSGGNSSQGSSGGSGEGSSQNSSSGSGGSSGGSSQGSGGNSGSGGSSQGSGDESGESSGSSSEGSGISSDSSKSSGGSENSKVNFKAAAPLYCFYDGKFVFEISDEDEIMGYMIASNKTKTSIVVVEDIKNEMLKDAKITIAIRKKKVHKKLRFENGVPCLDLKIDLNSTEINEAYSDKVINSFSQSEYDSIKDALKETLTKKIEKIFEKSKKEGADIFSAYELAYKFNYSKLNKYFKSEKDFIKNLNLNIEVNVKNMDT